MAFRFVFATDFHGIKSHYQRLFDFVRSQKIECLVFGGDLCPAGFIYNDFEQIQLSQREFLQKFFLAQLSQLEDSFPNLQCLAIMGNDDLRYNFDILIEAEQQHLLKPIHQRIIRLYDIQFLGYGCVPPTPFMIKDWEKYENSNKIIEPVAIPPEEGYHSTEIREKTTIEKDLSPFQDQVQSKSTIFVSHCPPYKTNLDHSTKDRYHYEGLKLDKHLGSISIRNFIESAQPLISLHGHIHESTAISGKYYDRIGNSLCLNGAFFVENTDATEILLMEVGDKVLYQKVTLT